MRSKCQSVYVEELRSLEGVKKISEWSLIYPIEKRNCLIYIISILQWLLLCVVDWNLDEFFAGSLNDDDHDLLFGRNREA